MRRPAAGNQQSRSYSYDFLGRMTSETNPENGTTNYTYDSDANCGSSSGDRVKRVDAVGNTTCLVYDALHRPTPLPTVGRMPQTLRTSTCLRHGYSNSVQ